YEFGVFDKSLFIDVENQEACVFNGREVMRCMNVERPKDARRQPLATPLDFYFHGSAEWHDDLGERMVVTATRFLIASDFGAYAHGSSVPGAHRRMLEHSTSR